MIQRRVYLALLEQHKRCTHHVHAEHLLPHMSSLYHSPPDRIDVSLVHKATYVIVAYKEENSVKAQCKGVRGSTLRAATWRVGGASFLHKVAL